jgi:hypothetical protein
MIDNKLTLQEVKDVSENRITIKDIEVSIFLSNFSTIFLSNMSAIDGILRKEKANSKIDKTRINKILHDREKLITSAIELFDLYTIVSDPNVLVTPVADIKSNIDDILNDFNTTMKVIIAENNFSPRDVRFS